MERIANTHRTSATKTTTKHSPVRTVLAWLVETDREFRVTQSMVNETHDRF